MRGAHDFADAEVDPAGLGLGALNEFLGAGNGAVGADVEWSFLKAEQREMKSKLSNVYGAAGDDVEHEQGIRWMPMVYPSGFWRLSSTIPISPVPPGL